jgi:methylated-DNA-[protein]-cysteine S-methyltransferase
MAEGFALFDTALGVCAIAWNDQESVVAVQLPDETPGRTRSRIKSRCRNATEATPPVPVADAIEAIRAMGRGERAGTADVQIDLRQVAPFDRAVYEITRTIEPGQVLTYGDIATRLGDPGKAQAVGQALGRNPCPMLVPCHRVVGAGGALVGFSAPGGIETKRRLLALEGWPPTAQLTLFDRTDRAR